MPEPSPTPAPRLLQHLGKLFRTDMVYVFRSSFWMAVAQGVASASSFLIAIAFANVLTKETYGSYKMIFSVMGVLSAFSMTAISIAVTRAAARGEDHAVLAGFRSNLAWGIPNLLLAVPVGFYYALKGQTDIAWGLAVAVPGALLIQSVELYGPYLVGKKEFKLNTRLAVLQTILSSALIASSLLVTRNVVAIVGAYFAANILTHIPLFEWVMRTFRVREKKPDGAAAVNYGKHLSVMNLLGTISFQLDKVLTFYFLGPVQLAIYSIAIAPPQQLRILGKNLSAISLPKLTEKTPAELKRILPRKAFIVLLFSGALVGCYVLGAPYLYRWFFPQYMESLSYSRWYALLILSFPTILFQNSLVAHEEKRGQYVIQVTIPIFKTILYLILIPMYQVKGVVASILVTEVLHILLVLFFFVRMKDKPVRQAVEDGAPAAAEVEVEDPEDRATRKD